MQYLLLIYNNEKEWEGQGPAALAQHMHDYTALTQDMAAKKQLVGGNRLQSVTTATTVRVVNGKTQMTDGPFAETREQLGGYYLIEAANLDEATGIAARIPGAKHGSVEVRPIFPMGSYPA
jgi:hypothetical protein